MTDIRIFPGHVPDAAAALKQSFSEQIFEYIDARALDRVTTYSLLIDALGLDPRKCTPSGAEAKLIVEILREMGWERRREGEPPRRWYWQSPPAPVDVPTSDKLDAERFRRLAACYSEIALEWRGRDGSIKRSFARGIAGTEVAASTLASLADELPHTRDGGNRHE